MGTVSFKNDQKIKKNISIYDVLVLIYVISIFSFENATFSLLFKIVQIVFFITSALILVKKQKFILPIGNMWIYAILTIALLLLIINCNMYTEKAIVIIIKNMIKVFAFSIYLSISWNHNAKKILYYLVIGGCICGLFLLYEFIKADLSYSNLKYATISRIGAGISGGNVNIVGMNMTFAFSSCIFFLQECHKKNKKVIWTIILVFIVGTSILTGSRKIVFVYIIITLLFYINKGLKYYFVFLVLMITLYITLMYIEPFYFLLGHKIDFFSDKMAYTMYYESDQHRLDLIRGAFNTFITHPWGIGFGNSPTYLGAYAHNNFLEVLMDGGIIGFIVYYGGYVYGLFYSILYYKKSTIGRYIFISIIGLLTIELGQVTYLYSSPMIFIALMLNIKQILFNKI